MIILRLKRTLKVPVEARCISQDIFEGKTVEDIRSLKVWEGNKVRKLGEIFEVEEKRGDNSTIRILGDLSKIRGIGYQMTHGRIIIEGNVGHRLGEELGGGEIIVHGDTGSWIGSSMKDGRIEIFGCTGDYIAAPYRGSMKGMRGGEIIVHGDVGDEAGGYMRGGLIVIDGCTGQFLGVHMKRGTILVKGSSEGRIGAEMVNGKIVVCGQVPSILPTFTFEDIKSSVKVDGEKIKGPFYRFIGDLTENGEGKLYISKAENPHLKFYERYL